MARGEKYGWLVLNVDLEHFVSYYNSISQDGGWSEETLGWMVRSAIRAATAGDASRWVLVEQAVSAMTPEQRNDPAWLYWQARALQARAGASAPLRQQARELLIQVADPLTFYGQLAAEALQGRPAAHPATPAPVSEAELARAEAEPGIDRALRMLALGWRQVCLVLRGLPGGCRGCQGLPGSARGRQGAACQGSEKGCFSRNTPFLAPETHDLGRNTPSRGVSQASQVRRRAPRARQRRSVR